MARYVVGTVDEIQPGTRKIVDAGGRSIGVFNVNGEYFAVLNRCPHQGGPLCKGNTHGLLRADAPGEYHYSRPGEILRCPWHGWEFDMRTGQSWFDPIKVRVRRYDVTVEPGSALIGETGGETGTGDIVPEAAAGTTPEEVAAAADPNAVSPTDPSMEGMQPGPYIAETFPVVVEQQYVIVEIGR
jgi:3-phenylpropionate/trans-cinnamate dioxygenase ferredoxin subunit